MKKKALVLLGVGSTYFTKCIVEALCRTGKAWDLRLCDIRPESVDVAIKLAQRFAEAYQSPITISGSTDRNELLPGADVVTATIGVGGVKARAKDLTMFAAHGIYQAGGETFGGAGISRSLRAVPVHIEIARDIERLCPNALFVNFSNPMGPMVWAITKYTSVKTVGLCVGTTMCQDMLAELIGAPLQETWSRAVGINHFTWLTDFLWNGEDAWPLVRKALTEKKEGRIFGSPYALELFDVFKAYPCVGDSHIGEFVPALQTHGGYYGKTFGIADDPTAEVFLKHRASIQAEMEDIAYGRKEIVKMPATGKALHDEDLFIDVLDAVSGGATIERSVNMPNAGQIPGMPIGAVIESTSLINSAGIHPLTMPDIPAGIRAVIMRILGAQEITMEAAVSGDRNLVVQALMAGLVANYKADAEKLADLILTEHKAYLPHFFK